MVTILLNLEGPFQSWGGQSVGGLRATGRHPSKSGVLGLIAACMGLPTIPPELASCRFGVRVDRPGRMLTDFQTMGVDGKGKRLPLETKQYLVDAAFTAGIETPDPTLADQVMRAVQRPVWQPYLGRLACRPSPPINPILTDQPLEDALTGDGGTWIEPSAPDPVTDVVRYDQPTLTGHAGRFERQTTSPSDDDYRQLVASLFGNEEGGVS